MRRLILPLALIVLLGTVAPAAAQYTLPLEANVPDAAAIRISGTGFDFFSEAATDILLGLDIAGMLMELNPILEMECTNMLITYLELVANISEVNLDNLGVQIGTVPVMSLTPIPDALFFKLWFGPTAGLTMIKVDVDGYEGSSGCTDPFTASAEINIDPLEIGGSVTIDYEPEAEGFVVTIHQVKAEFNDLEIVLTGFPAGLDDLIEELINTIIVDLIEELAPELINDLLEEQLGDIVLEGSVPVGDYTLAYAFDPDFDTDYTGMTASTDGSMFIEGTTIDPCIDDGQQTGSIYTPNPLPDFGLLTPGGDPYHFALALSDDLLNQLLYSFVAKGDLCLMFPWGWEDPLTLAAFAGMMPGWDAGPVEDESNLVDLYPLDIPHFVVGQGVTDLALVTQPYRLDWYILREDRYVTMISAEIDLTLALSMETDEENNLIITLEGTDVVFDVNGTEFNVIPPDLIENLINGIIEFFLPMIVDILPPIPLPAIMNYQFVIHEIGALGQADDYFGLYCEFVESANKGPRAAFDLLSLGVRTDITLGAKASALAGLAATDHPALRLATLDDAPVDHYLARVDGGFWRRLDDGQLDLTWFVEGRHEVEALAVAPNGQVSSERARLSFVVDRVAPRLDSTQLVRGRDYVELRVKAHDYVAETETIRFQVRLGDAPWSEPFAATSVRLPGLPTSGGVLQVRALDPAGNVSEPVTVRSLTTIRHRLPWLSLPTFRR